MVSGVSLTRRPNSENTSVATRPSIPRAVRSAWNAPSARESSASCLSCAVIWLVWVSKPPQWIVMIRVPRLAPSRWAAIRRRADSVLVFGYAVLAGAAPSALTSL